MAAGVYNFSIDQGTKHSFQIAYKNADMLPKNIIGFGLRGHIKRKINDCDLLAEFEFEILDASLGSVKVTLPPSAFENEVIKSNTYKDALIAQYDIELYSLTDPTDVRRLLNGTIKVSPEVTK